MLKPPVTGESTKEIDLGRKSFDFNLARIQLSLTQKLHEIGARLLDNSAQIEKRKVSWRCSPKLPQEPKRILPNNQPILHVNFIANLDARTSAAYGDRHG